MHRLPVSTANDIFHLQLSARTLHFCSSTLTHLVYLTSTSPRITEIMTMDCDPERLVRILHDFYISPPPPDKLASFYGLSSAGIPGWSARAQACSDSTPQNLR